MLVRTLARVLDIETRILATKLVISLATHACLVDLVYVAGAPQVLVGFGGVVLSGARWIGRPSATGWRVDERKHEMS